MGWQILWAREFALGLGHQAVSSVCVVATFFLGSALGGVLFDRLRQRGVSIQRLLNFSLIGVAAFGIAAFGSAAWVGEQWARFAGLNAPRALDFLIPLLLLLPATVCIGLLFPAIIALGKPNQIGALYGANIFGAVSGALLVSFAVLPNVSSWTAAVVICGALVAAVVVSQLRSSRREEAQISAKVETNIRASLPRLLRDKQSVHWHIALFLLGLIGLGYENAVFLALGQVLENTTYSFPTAISAMLLGTATGSLIFQWRKQPPQLGKSVLFTTILVSLGFPLLQIARPVYQALRGVFGDSLLGVMGAEFGVSAVILVGPAIGFGYLFSIFLANGIPWKGSAGSFVAVNALGCAAAGLLVGFVLLPLGGFKLAFVAVSLLMALLAMLCSSRREEAQITSGCGTEIRASSPRLLRRYGLLAFIPVIGVVFAPSPLLFPVEKGETVTFHQESLYGTTIVTRDQRGFLTLRVNGRLQMGGTGAAAAQLREGHIPLLLHPDPHNALFIGTGTGITPGAAHFHPGLAVDGVELNPEIVRAMPLFAEFNHGIESKVGNHWFVHDARRVLVATTNRYDVIVSDLFHPAIDGSAFLYTTKHFELVRNRLQTDGVACQWLPLHQMNAATFKTVCASFLAVFPDSELWLLRFNSDLPIAALVSRPKAAFNRLSVETKVMNAILGNALQPLSLGDSLRLFGLRLCGPERLKQFSAGAPLNLDSQPRLLYQAPLHSYRRYANSSLLLPALLELADSDDRWLPSDTTAQFKAVLAEFVAARNAYLRGVLAESNGNQAKMLDEFMASVRLSNEFTQGYADLLSLATSESSDRPKLAKQILDGLIEARPDVPPARELRKRLFGN